MSRRLMDLRHVPLSGYVPPLPVRVMTDRDFDALVRRFTPDGLLKQIDAARFLGLSLRERFRRRFDVLANRVR